MMQDRRLYIKMLERRRNELEAYKSDLVEKIKQQKQDTINKEHDLDSIVFVLISLDKEIEEQEALLDVNEA